MKKSFKLELDTVVSDVRDSLTLMDAVELYLSNFKDSTRRSYKATLNEWCRYFNNDITNITRTQAIKFFLEQKKKMGQNGRITGSRPEITAETIQRKRVILKAFYKFLEGEGLASAKIFDFPLEHGEKAVKRPTECIPFEKVSELLSLHSGKTLEAIRNNAILHHLFYTGCRRAEICNFLIGHFKLRADGRAELTSVTTKTGAPLTRIVSQECACVIHLQAQRRLSQGFRGDAYMYPSLKGENGLARPLGAKTLYRYFKQWCEEVGLDPNLVSPHSARATLVTKMLSENGGDYEAVSQVTGHKGFQVIQRYDKRFNSLENNPGATLSWTKKKSG